MFIVTVNDLTGHYLYNFNPLVNDFTEILNKYILSCNIFNILFKNNIYILFRNGY